MNKSIFQKLLADIEEKKEVALVTLIEDSESEVVGDKLLINLQSQEIIKANEPSLSEAELKELSGYISKEVFPRRIGRYKLDLSSPERKIGFIVEPYHPRPRLIICGGGHVGQALYSFGKKIDFDLVMIDDRADFANSNLFPEAEVICTEFENLKEELELSRRDYIVVATRGHQHDYFCLEKILSSPAKYIGMLGSRRKVDVIFDKLDEAGYSKEEIAKIKAPIGLEIGSETPEEIGVSILAEVIKVRRKEGYDNITQEVIEFLADYDGNDDLALATVIKTSGSTPRQPGAKMAVLADGRSIGTIGGGTGEVEIKKQALDLIDSDNDLVIYSLELDNETVANEGMICGGNMEVLIESFGSESQKE